MASNYSEEELKQQFRNVPSTVNDTNHRKWMYPKKPAGKWFNLRMIVGYGLLLGFILLPFIQVDGHPYFLVNILERKFILFGNIFWPQDIYLIALAALIFFVFIILFTVVYGRVWCGWSCPQTILMELVFRRIEYFFEGDANKAKKLDQQPWNTEKILRKGGKHAFFILVSIFMGHIVMAYIIGMPEVLVLIQSNPMNHLGGFGSLVAFSAIFYLVFSQVREIVCTVICPYGRLQGVLLNRESMVVAYDYVRGEPRGIIRKNQDQSTKGDCVDCGLCVQVCPTGIDIRNGTQLECINCTACIDACNDVMLKVKKPKGLIRFDSIEGIEKKLGFRFSGRVLAYSVVLVVLTGIFGFLMTARTDVQGTLMRVPGQIYQTKENGNITNLYNIQMINKTFDVQKINLELGKELEGARIVYVSDSLIEIGPQGSVETTFFVEVPKDQIPEMKNKITLKMISHGEVIKTEKTTFLAPSK